MSEADIERAIQQALDEDDDANGVVVTGWIVVWEGQSIEAARDDEHNNGVFVPDGQSPAFTLGLLEQGRRNAVTTRRSE